MKKGIRMTRAEVDAHQRRHGFIPTIIDDGKAPFVIDKDGARPLKSRMNGTETRYSLILEAMKRRGDIQDYKFEGVTLRWGIDPETGKAMAYTPDFVVTKSVPIECESCGKQQTVLLTYYRMIEVKGAHIRSRDLVRFKGCRSDWPQFQFEMHQWKGGSWQRIH